MSQLEGIGDALGIALEKLGVEALDVLIELTERWESIGGDPWYGVSRPIVIRRGELVVEADPASAVRYLSYATSDLMRSLEGYFGRGVVVSIRVVPTSRR
jgi:hypothetical protein